MLEELVPLCRGRATLRVLDVDTRKEWQEAFGDRVPVLCLGDRELSVAQLDRKALMAALETAG
jgi:thioredoxin reductase (NADPH)